MTFAAKFQSPRSGKFVSDKLRRQEKKRVDYTLSFNPLDRGNLYQILNSKVFGREVDQDVSIP